MDFFCILYREVRNDRESSTISNLQRKTVVCPLLFAKGLQVDEVFSFGSDHQHNTKVGVVGEKRE